MDLYTLLTKCKIHFDKDKIFNHEVRKIVENSQKAEINSVFIAIKGEENDGHDYIIDVANQNIKTIIYEDKYYDYIQFENTNMIKVHDSKKALAILSHVFFDKPSRKVNIIGVTGTNGKTTVSTMIYQIFSFLKRNCTLIGTNGIKLGNEAIESPNTTPSNLIIQKTIANSIDEGIKDIVMEVSSHAIKQERVSQIDFNTVIYTNFSHDHLDYHKTFDDYFYSKGLLFAYLGNFFNEKKVLFNGDDKYFKKFIRLTNVEAYTYGLGEENDFQARDISCDVDKISFKYYCFNEFIGTVNTNNIFGFFNVYNLLAIISYFYINHYNMDEILDKLPLLKSVTGRMQKVLNPYHLNVFIDYAHTPDSVFRVLNEIKMISRKNIICVIGCGGDRDALKRPLIGKITTNLADYVIFTTDNPRFEEPSSIINDMVQGVCDTNYIVIENRRNAIKYALEIISENDVVVILGKGHEHYQIIKDKKEYFNDYDEVIKFIKLRLNKDE
ncbi:UDP-N-acetylmuramoyl-L-alanyl-D-glutamate--2,6-diaminopimelate ligase [Mycoplasmatota bacterium]|nr:UDP-N-acetylmuramoyl-L-alanyl-D-glutamate--2,6-diaminopimelate ligase [Mycoplasmatota bacterium]